MERRRTEGGTRRVVNAGSALPYPTSSPMDRTDPPLDRPGRELPSRVESSAMEPSTIRMVASLSDAPQLGFPTAPNLGEVLQSPRKDHENREYPRFPTMALVLLLRPHDNSHREVHRFAGATHVPEEHHHDFLEIPSARRPRRRPRCPLAGMCALPDFDLLIRSNFRVDLGVA